jgi:Fic family protein
MLNTDIINHMTNGNLVSTERIFDCPEIRAEEQAALAHIEALRRDLRFYVAEPRRWLGPVRKVLAARAIQGSNSIEGYNVSVEDAVAALEGDEPTEATAENWAAVANYRRAMTYVLQLAHDDHFRYSDALLRSLHFMMTEHDLDASPGLWRPGPIWVQSESTGAVMYEGPENEIVPELVDALVAQLDTDADERAPVRAAMAHLNLVMIHPFRDGNGRMARCLQTLVLAREGILVPEFCSIEEYLGRNTQSYYEVLAVVGQGRWNPQHDARPWVRYCLQAHYVQAASVLRRVRESEKIWTFLEETLEGSGLPVRTLDALFDASIGMKVRNASYRSATKASGEEISNQSATTDLRHMVDAGLLTKHGAKRGTYYVASEELARFHARLRRERPPITTEHLFDPSVAAAPTLF